MEVLSCNANVVCVLMMDFVNVWVDEGLMEESVCPIEAEIMEE